MQLAGQIVHEGHDYHWQTFCRRHTSTVVYTHVFAAKLTCAQDTLPHLSPQEEASSAAALLTPQVPELVDHVLRDRCLG